LAKYQLLIYFAKDVMAVGTELVRSSCKQENTLATGAQDSVFAKQINRQD